MYLLLIENTTVFIGKNCRFFKITDKISRLTRSSTSNGGVAHLRKSRI